MSRAESLCLKVRKSEPISFGFPAGRMLTWSHLQMVYGAYDEANKIARVQFKYFPGIKVGECVEYDAVSFDEANGVMYKLIDSLLIHANTNMERTDVVGYLEREANAAKELQQYEREQIAQTG